MSGHRSSGSAEAILDASPDAIVLVDSIGRISHATGRVSDLFEYEPGELVGEPIEVLVPSEISDEHVADRDAYLADPETRPMGAGLDLSGRRKDGSTFPVDISLSPIEIDDETHVITVVRDMSEREAIRRKYQTILEAVPDAVVVADATTGEIVEVNGQVTTLTGYEPEELIGNPQTMLHPSEESERYRSLFKQHVRTEQDIFLHFSDGSNIYVETRTGERVPVEINAYVFELQNEELIAGVFRDITLRKEREEALEQLHTTTRDLMNARSVEEVASIASETATEVLDLSMNGVHIYDDEVDALVPVAWTDASESVFDGSPPDIDAGEGVAWNVYECGRPRAHGNVREIEDVMNEQTPFQSELYLPLGEHGVWIVSSMESDDFDEADRVLAQVLAANVEAALDRVERENALETKNERLNEFASIVSHDLRNPLNVAEGRLALARQNSDSENLAEVSRALDRMERLIEDLLTVARQGDAVTEFEAIELPSIVEQCWRTVQTANATLVLETSRVIRANRSRLQQLLENLLRNAVEHGGDAVTVTVGDLEDGFYVEDDGTGLPETKRKELFDTGVTTATDGTGLGLSIAEQIATAHGWEITATTGSTGGARFEITVIDDRS